MGKPPLDSLKTLKSLSFSTNVYHINLIYPILSIRELHIITKRPGREERTGGGGGGGTKTQREGEGEGEEKKIKFILPPSERGREKKLVFSSFTPPEREGR